MGCVACRSHCEDCSDNGLSFGARARPQPVRVLATPGTPTPSDPTRTAAVLARPAAQPQSGRTDKAPA